MRTISPDTRTQAGLWKILKVLKDYTIHDEDYDYEIHKPYTRAGISSRSDQLRYAALHCVIILYDMNFLKQLGIYALIIAVPIVSCLGPWWVSENILNLSEPFPMLIGFGSLALLFFIFFRWMIHLQEKENRTVGTFTHPFWGKVTRKKISGKPPIHL